MNTIHFDRLAGVTSLRLVRARSSSAVTERLNGSRRRRTVPIVLLMSDLIALCVVLRLATGHFALVASAYVVSTIGLLTAAGAFRHRLSLRLINDIPALLGAMALAVLPLVPLLRDHQELLDIIGVIPLAAVLVIAGRTVAYTAIRFARTRHRLQARTLIVGSGPIAIELGQVLRAHPEYGLVPVGFLDGYRDGDLPSPLLGDVEALADVLRQFEIDTVIVAFGSNGDRKLVKVLRACDKADTSVHVVPRFFELGAPAQCKDVDSLWGIPVVRLRRKAIRSRTWRLKRMFDVVIVSLLAPLIAPAFGLIALAVCVTSRGPIFFRQQRVGQGGRLVNVVKFRTLLVNDDSDTTWSVRNDDRQTSVGRFLRKSSLDELPQLINVLKGDMSLVGPRPERPHFVSRFDADIPNYGDRHRVPVGMTGWAQIHGLRGDTSLEERARFDNDYIEQWSLVGDLVILFRTVTAVLRDLISRCPEVASSTPGQVAPAQTGPVSQSPEVAIAGPRTELR